MTNASGVHYSAEGLGFASAKDRRDFVRGLLGTQAQQLLELLEAVECTVHLSATGETVAEAYEGCKEMVKEADSKPGELPAQYTVRVRVTRPEPGSLSIDVVKGEVASAIYISHGGHTGSL